MSVQNCPTPLYIYTYIYIYIHIYIYIYIHIFINTAVCNEMGISRSVTSAYHPQTNGLDERTNQTLKNRLIKLSNDHQNNWPELLDPVSFSIRTQKHGSTKFTPFELMFGRKPITPMEVFDTRLVIWYLLATLLYL